MHLKPVVWCAPCMVCGSSKQSTGLERPWVLIASHRVIWGSITSPNTKQTTIGNLKTIYHVLQLYGQPCSSMLALHLSSLISFRNGKRTGNQPHRKQVELHAMPSFDPCSKQWLTLWLVCSEMSISPKLNSLHYTTAIASQWHPWSVHNPSTKCC